MTGYGKRGKPKPGFPLFPQPLEIALAIPTFPQPRPLSYPKRKEPPRRIASLPPSGSFFNEKMLVLTWSQLPWVIFLREPFSLSLVPNSGLGDAVPAEPGLIALY